MKRMVKEYVFFLSNDEANRMVTATIFTIMSLTSKGRKRDTKQVNELIDYAEWLISTLEKQKNKIREFHKQRLIEIRSNATK